MLRHVFSHAFRPIGPRLILIVLLAVPVAGGAGSLKIATWNTEHLMAEAGTGCKPRTANDYAGVRRYADRLDADVTAPLPARVCFY